MLYTILQVTGWVILSNCCKNTSAVSRPIEWLIVLILLITFASCVIRRVFYSFSSCQSHPSLVSTRCLINSINSMYVSGTSIMQLWTAILVLAPFGLWCEHKTGIVLPGKVASISELVFSANTYCRTFLLSRDSSQTKLEATQSPTYNMLETYNVVYFTVLIVSAWPTSTQFVCSVIYTNWCSV